jgi:hypothetical protein
VEQHGEVFYNLNYFGFVGRYVCISNINKCICVLINW